MRHFLFGPRQEALAVIFEELFQQLGGQMFSQQGFLLAADIVVDQRQLQFIQLPALAQQVAIDPDLRPVQMTMIVWHAAEVAAIGLDLLQPVQLRIVAVGAAAHQQRTEAAAQADFSFISS